MPTARKTTPKDEVKVLDFDALVEDGGPAAPSTDDTGGEQTTEEHDNNNSAELAFLRAELEAAKAQLQSQQVATPGNHRVTPEAELTPEQKQIRELQDQLARVNGKKEGVLTYEENVAGGIIVHFLSQQTFTSNNKNFYYGQEVIFGPEAYKETIDRFGNSWLNMTDDDQYARWGEVKFRKGPWPGVRVYEDPALVNVSVVTQAPVTTI